MKTIFGLVMALFIFTGCSSLSMNGVKTSDIQHTFKNGTIKTSQKVLIGKDKLSTLAYAGVGAAVGMGAGAALGNTKGGVIGALVGAAAGTLTSDGSSLSKMLKYLLIVRSLGSASLCGRST